MCLDISDFYLETPLKRSEYVKLKLQDIPNEIIVEYKLHEKATSDGCVYVKVQKGMYGLPQAGLLSNEMLERRLAPYGYYQSPRIPGLWKHRTRPIQFTLVVDDFGVKYTRKEDALHLIAAIKACKYRVKADWTGGKYIGIALD